MDTHDLRKLIHNESITGYMSEFSISPLHKLMKVFPLLIDVVDAAHSIPAHIAGCAALTSNVQNSCDCGMFKLNQALSNLKDTP